MAGTLSAWLVAARAQAIGVAGAKLSEETIHTIRQPGRSPKHQEFAIGRTRSVPLEGRQRPAVGMPVHHSIQLIAAFQLNPKDRATSLDTAIAFEAALRAKMLDQSWHSAAAVAANCVYTGTEEAAGVDGWVWFTLGFDVTQTLDIS